MFEHFQPWINYKKMMELQAQGTYYCLPKQSKTNKNQQVIVTNKRKQLQIGRK